MIHLIHEYARVCVQALHVPAVVNWHCVGDKLAHCGNLVMLGYARSARSESGSVGAILKQVGAIREVDFQKRGV